MGASLSIWYVLITNHIGYRMISKDENRQTHTHTGGITMKTIVMIAVVLVIAGCGNSPTTPGGDTDDTIADLINGEYAALFDIPYTDDGGADYGGESSDGEAVARGNCPLSINDEDDPAQAFLPAGWGRRPTELPVRDIFIHMEGDSIASVTVDAALSGRLYVDTTFDHIINPGVKPIEDHGTRYSVFKRDRAQSERKWFLHQISPLEIRLEDPAEQTVSIEYIAAYVDEELVWDVSDPGELMNFVEDIPRFEGGTEVTVEAEVSNSNTKYAPSSFLFLHTPDSRHLMYDDGETRGDRIADDCIFTGRYIVGTTPGFKHAAVDIIDSECLQNEVEDDYNSTAWAMPYEVLP
jgi:hypothetical protein